MPRLHVSPPWEEYKSRLEVFFKDDKDIRIIYDDENPTDRIITLYVENATKADALSILLCDTKEFGNITVHVRVMPCNVTRVSYVKNDVADPEQLFRNAFAGNPIVDTINVIRGIRDAELVYIMFKNEVVQYWNDNLSDYNGFCSTLYQILAHEIFNDIPNVYYCTAQLTYTLYLPNQSLTCEAGQLNG